MAVAAFWIALAAVLIAGSWRKKSIEQMRHDTVRLLIEQGKDVDQEQVAELINPPPPPPLPEGHPLYKRPDPWAGYRGLRGVGVVLMIAAIGLGAMISIAGYATNESAPILIGPGVGLFVFMLGFALFYVARYARPDLDMAVKDPRKM